VDYHGSADNSIHSEHVYIGSEYFHMSRVRLSWICLLGAITLIIHGLIIDDWTTDRDQKLPIQILAWVLSFLLGVATVTSAYESIFDSFIWGTLTYTAVSIALAANEMFDPTIIAIIWGVTLLVLGCCGMPLVANYDPSDTRTILYVSGILLSLGGGILCSVAHNVTLAAVGFLVALWTITIVFILYTLRNIVDRTPAMLAGAIAVGFTIGVSVALAEHHVFIILLLGWIFNLFMWIGWVVLAQ